MTYRDHLLKQIAGISSNERVRWIGYNVCPEGGSAGGSLKGIPQEQIVEMPLAENLMVGAAIGYALDGFIPIVWLERFDFALCCADAIVNHLSAMAELSEGMHKPGVIIRVCVGNKESPLFTGPVHTQNFSEAFQKMCKFHVHELKTIKSLNQFQWALDAAKAGKSTMLVEFKDLYGMTE